MNFLQELDQCTNGFKGQYCYNQAMNAISSEPLSKLIIIVNCEKTLMNGGSIKFINYMTNQEKTLFVYPNIEKFGINLFGNQLKVLEILAPLTLDEEVNVIEPFLDHNENKFSNVDVWKHSQIYSKYVLGDY